MRFSIMIVIFLAAMPLAIADTLKVPKDYSTIQAAIQAANSGDTVLVESGTYDENIDFLGKAIIVTSEYGPYHTVIDGGQAGSVVKFVNGEKTSSILDGFEITNGTGTQDTLVRGIAGGGIYCKNTRPKLTNLLVVQNQADKGGGLFSSNVPSGQNLVLENVFLESNTALVAGGGLFLQESHALMTGCKINDNQAVGADGGGIYGYVSSVTMAECAIIGNQSAFWGGGLVSLFGEGVTMQNTVVASNTAEVTGGGLSIFYGENAKLDLLNTTIVDNTAVQGWGGGIYVAVDAVSHKITNSILWGNTAPDGKAIAIDLSDFEVEYCDVEGGMGSILVSSGSLTYGASNISVPPIFANAAARDYHLLAGSGGIDAGDNNAANLPAFDFEGDDRINNGTVDMGVDEHYSPYMYFTGLPKAGEDFELNLLGAPSAWPVTIYIGSGVLTNPIPTAFGDWYLEVPVKFVDLFPMPSNGFLSLQFTMPGNLTLPPGLGFPMQTLIGTELTPLAILVLK